MMRERVMRDIKFRAWDHVDNVMLFADIYELKDIGGEWTAWDLPPDSPVNTGTPFKVMQFTGLQDKFGIDIYEGDIVDGVIHGDYSKHIGFILFDYNGYRIKTSTKSLSLELTEKLTIIGNIYQNPELLGGNKS